MSMFDNVANWPKENAACATPNQSPIDLAAGSAEKCDLLCDFTMKDTFIGSVTGEFTPSGLGVIISGQDAPVTYNGAEYQGVGGLGMMLYTPSQHTIGGTRYDAECVMFFRLVGGGDLRVSVMVESNSRESPSKDFFSKVVPYMQRTGSASGSNITIKGDWSPAMALPAEPSYFVYKGSAIEPSCEPCTWIVFRNPVNMHPDDMAFLKRNMKPGYRPTQPLNGRTVYLNDGANVALSDSQVGSDGDNRVYIKCSKLESDVTIQKLRQTAAKPPPVSAQLQAKAAGADKGALTSTASTVTGAVGNAAGQLKAYVEVNGGWVVAAQTVLHAVFAAAGFFAGRGLMYRSPVPSA